MKSAHSCSITCVGDDYQSIYGWRGAAPIFFLQYLNNFPSREYAEIQLYDNFRSLQKIIDAGEFLLRDIEHKKYKHVTEKSKSLAPLDADPVELFAMRRSDDLMPLIDNFIKQYGKHELRVMSLTNDPIENYVKLCKERETQLPENIDIHTYHKSKGLEASVCVLLNSYFSPPPFPLRNAVYALAWRDQHDYSQTYDEAQDDEAKRIGYVAVTRAKVKAIILHDDRMTKGLSPEIKTFLDNYENMEGGACTKTQ